jgi:uncharacterized protein YndB with AHSA1/START domain
MTKMTTTILEEQAVQSFEIQRHIDINAPIDITFESVLEELGPESVMPDGKPFPLKLEAWPGGRWFRDLGNNAGHLWGHVQVIKPPTLLEICGPMPMSYPAVNHVQWRLTSKGTQTNLKITHKAMGLILPEHRDGMPEGWEFGLERVRQIAETKAHARNRM